MSETPPLEPDKDLDMHVPGPSEARLNDPGNPFQSPADVAEAPPEKEPPWLWPAFAVGATAIVLGIIVSAVTIAGAIIVSGNIEILHDTQAFGEWVGEFVNTRAGLMVLVLPGQLTFLAVALGAAQLSRSTTADCLGLRRGTFPLWTWPLFFLATPVVSMIASMLVSTLVDEPSEQMKMFEQLFAEHSSQTLPLLILLVSVVPGVVEEVLFRGYIQRRLLARLPAVIAIGISTVFFAGAHMDPTHAIGVIPLGIWLGIIAWRADSIWPAILGHAGNNALAIALSTMVSQDAAPDTVAISPAFLGISALSFLACLVVLAKCGPRTEAVAEHDSGVIFIEPGGNGS